MRSIVALFLMLSGLLAVPSHAREAVATVIVEEWVEDGAGRFVASEPSPLPDAIASYGPFRVLAGDRAALVGVTDAATPGQFAAMLRMHPAIRTLEMVDCGGTEDDRANMTLGRMLRAAGVATYVPRGGSVRSGAVELFLAGATRRIDDGAEFAVHSWLDDEGREPSDFAADARENRAYIDYYREMGMDEARAEAFYAMTNSVPFDDARWLDAAEMRDWLTDAKEAPAAGVTPRIAYLDLAAANF